MAYTTSPLLRARIPFPSLAFAGAMTIPLKSPPSPPSTTTSPSDFSLPSPTDSISISPLATTTTAYANCAFPSWPKSDVLSPSSSPTSSSSSTSSTYSTSPYLSAGGSGQAASSYITDDDLLDLATLPLYNNIRIPPEFLIAATPIQSPVVEKRRSTRPRSQRVILPESLPEIRVEEVESEKVEKVERRRRRRRSSPLKKRGMMVLGLSPVIE